MERTVQNAQLATSSTIPMSKRIIEESGGGGKAALGSSTPRRALGDLRNGIKTPATNKTKSTKIPSLASVFRPPVPSSTPSVIQRKWSKNADKQESSIHVFEDVKEGKESKEEEEAKEDDPESSREAEPEKEHIAVQVAQEAFLEDADEDDLEVEYPFGGVVHAHEADEFLPSSREVTVLLEDDRAESSELEEASFCQLERAFGLGDSFRVDSLSFDNLHFGENRGPTPLLEDTNLSFAEEDLDDSGNYCEMFIRAPQQVMDMAPWTSLPARLLLAPRIFERTLTINNSLLDDSAFEDLPAENAAWPVSWRDEEEQTLAAMIDERERRVGEVILVDDREDNLDDYLPPDVLVASCRTNASEDRQSSIEGALRY